MSVFFIVDHWSSGVWLCHLVISVNLIVINLFAQIRCAILIVGGVQIYDAFLRVIDLILDVPVHQ